MNPKFAKTLKTLRREWEEIFKRLETNTHTKEDAALIRELVEVVSLFSKEELSLNVSPQKIREKFRAYYEQKTP